MKKIVLLPLIALCLPLALPAQSVDDDLYYVPTKKEKKVVVEEKNATPTSETVVVKTNAPTTVYSSTGNTTVVVKDRKGNVRDVDEYNRRYTSKENDFVMDNDTLYIEEKAVPDLEGEWVDGFDGSQDDYEYATRIIRFRNPRYAISISSPLYWDVVYGLNTWDWNVYTDGLYAYAFPTFTNPLWWDWRYNSYGWGWGYPYYGFGWYGWGGFYAGWGGWYGGWGPGWGYHHHYHPGYWGDRHWGNAFTSRRSYGTRASGITRSPGRTSTRRSSVVNGGQTRRTSSATGVRQSGTSTRRVVGTRSSSTSTRTGVTRSGSTSTRRSTYTRPSSTRSSSYNGVSTRTSSRSGVGVPTRGSSTYSRGSSTYSRSSSTTRTYNDNNEGTHRTYSSSPSRSYGSSRSSFSSGGSRSGGYSGGGVSRGGGGGRSRR